MKREELLNKRTFGYIFLILVLLAGILGPWIDIRFTYKQRIYNTEGQEIYTSNGLGSAIFLNVSIIENTTVANDLFPHQQIFMQAYITPLLLIALIFLVIQLVLLIGKFEFKNPVLTMLFKGKEEIPPLTLLISGIFTFLGAVVFYMLYPNLYVFTGTKYYTISGYVDRLIRFSDNIPNLDKLDKAFNYKPGMGAELTLFLGIIMLTYYIHRVFTHFQLRKTWKFRGAIFFIGILLIISPIYIYQQGELIGVQFGFQTSEIIEYGLLSVIGLALILAYRFISEGKVLVMDIQFLSLDLPPDEYRRRLEIVRKYSPITRIINAIVNLLLFGQLIVSIQLTAKMINLYNSLKQVNAETFSFLYTTFISPLNTFVSTWLIWALPLITLASLLILVD